MSMNSSDNVQYRSDAITIRFSATSEVSDYYASLQALSADHDCPLCDRCVTIELRDLPSDGRIFQACHAASHLLQGHYGDNKPSCAHIDVCGGMASESVRNLNDVKPMIGKATDVQATAEAGTIFIDLDKGGDGSSDLSYELLARIMGYLSLCANQHTLVIGLHPDRNFNSSIDGSPTAREEPGEEEEPSELEKVWTYGSEFAESYEKFFKKRRGKVVLSTDIQSLHGVSDWSGRNWNGQVMSDEDMASTRWWKPKYKYK